MKAKIIMKVDVNDLAKMDTIAKKGTASNGYWQTLEYCIDKAIKEFIEKYLPTKEE